MVRQRIKQWGIQKNVKESEMKFVWRKLRTAQDAGSPTPSFKLRGRQLTLLDVHSHFSKKLQPRQCFDDLLTPTCTEAPTPSEATTPPPQAVENASDPNYSSSPQLSSLPKGGAGAGQHQPILEWGARDDVMRETGMETGGLGCCDLRAQDGDGHLCGSSLLSRSSISLPSGSTFSSEGLIEALQLPCSVHDISNLIEKLKEEIPTRLNQIYEATVLLAIDTKYNQSVSRLCFELYLDFKRLQFSFTHFARFVNNCASRLDQQNLDLLWLLYGYIKSRLWKQFARYLYANRGRAPIYLDVQSSLGMH